MNRARFLTIIVVFAGGCATETTHDPLVNYEEVHAATILAAPQPVPGKFSSLNREVVARGKNMVELLGCSVCHTDGALVGDPDPDRALAGSQTGIAYANPLGDNNPGVVYPPNITPDDKTGIGGWTDAQIANAIRAGIGRHGGRRITYMPWQGYAKLSDEDVNAIVSYLHSIASVDHEVPERVEPGERAKRPFIYFGVYRSKR